MQQCLLCPCVSTRKSDLKNHFFTLHGSETTCFFCNHETSATDNNTMQTSLTEHMWQCHATALHEAITMTHNMDRSRYPGEYLSTLEHAITDMEETLKNHKKKYWVQQASNQYYWDNNMVKRGVRFLSAKHVASSGIPPHAHMPVSSVVSDQDRIKSLLHDCGFYSYVADRFLDLNFTYKQILDNKALTNEILQKNLNLNIEELEVFNAIRESALKEANEMQKQSMLQQQEMQEEMRKNKEKDANKSMYLIQCNEILRNMKELGVEKKKITSRKVDHLVCDLVNMDEVTLECLSGCLLMEYNVLKLERTGQKTIKEINQKKGEDKKLTTISIDSDVAGTERIFYLQSVQKKWSTNKLLILRRCWKNFVEDPTETWNSDKMIAVEDRLHEVYSANEKLANTSKKKYTNLANDFWPGVLKVSKNSLSGVVGGKNNKSWEKMHSRLQQKSVQ